MIGAPEEFQERYKKDSRLLWAATLTAMAASWTHLAHWLASWEHEGWIGLLAGAAGATAIDLGVLAGMRRIDLLAQLGAPTKGARRTVYSLTAVSALANIMNAVEARLAREGMAQPAAPIDWIWLYVSAALAVGVLPLIVLRLTELLDTAPRLAQQPTGDELLGETELLDDEAEAEAEAEEADRRPARRRTGRARPARQRLKVGDPLARVSEAATGSPFCSQRELARLSGVGETTVRRLVAKGDLRATAEGWKVATA